MIRLTNLFIVYLSLFFGLSQVKANTFTLKSQCPPGFEKTQANQCKLRSLYQLYDSMQGVGVGGTQTALPEIRDGFTPQEIDLGRFLFFDPLLSEDQTLSCASCHQPELGFADGVDRSVGVQGTKVPRSAPSLWNVGFLKRLFWDSRASTLEKQAEGPLYDAKEMGNNPADLLVSLRSNQDYQRMFKLVFPASKQIELAQIYRALAAFQSSLISLNSRYDQYAHGNHQALNAKEIEGMNIYRSFVARCSECHTPPLFTNQQIAVIGTPEPDGMPLDIGAEKTFNAEELKGGFKVPSLRNIVKTQPYMHSGKFEKLRDAVEFYNKGRGHAVPENVKMQIHWHIWEPNLTDEELDRIVDFLGALTDETFMPETPKQVPSGLTPITHKHNDNNFNLDGE